MKKLVAIAFVVLVCSISIIILLGKDNTDKTSEQNKKQNDKSTVSNDSAFDKTRFSIDNPSSLWVIVNKQRSIPFDYQPADLIAAGNGELLRKDVVTNLSKLLVSARQSGAELRVISGYRSSTAQRDLYNSYVNSDGQQQADTYSARPKYSEHQTGLATDLGNLSGYCDLDICFSQTPGGKWLAKNAHKFGFIVRYQKGKENITGYQAEPWHIRYVGKDLAQQIYSSKKTLEEFFDLSPAPSY